MKALLNPKNMLLVLTTLLSLLQNAGVVDTVVEPAAPAPCTVE